MSSRLTHEPSRRRTHPSFPLVFLCLPLQQVTPPTNTPTFLPSSFLSSRGCVAPWFISWPQKYHTMPPRPLILSTPTTWFSPHHTHTHTQPPITHFPNLFPPHPHHPTLWPQVYRPSYQPILTATVLGHPTTQRAHPPLTSHTQPSTHQHDSLLPYLSASLHHREHTAHNTTCTQHMLLSSYTIPCTHSINTQCKGGSKTNGGWEQKETVVDTENRSRWCVCGWVHSIMR